MSSSTAIVGPLARMLEVFKRVDRQWLQSQVFDGNRAERVRAEPFDAVELDLQRWWLAE